MLECVNNSSVQLLSNVRVFATPWTAACHDSLPITNCRSSLKLTSIESVMPSRHLILGHPLLLLLPIPPSIRVFSNGHLFKHNSFQKIPGSISSRMYWLDLLAVQGTLKSSPTLQFKSINSSALNFLHSPTLTAIHDHWKNHSLD